MGNGNGKWKWQMEMANGKQKTVEKEFVEELGDYVCLASYKESL